MMGATKLMMLTTALMSSPSAPITARSAAASAGLACTQSEIAVTTATIRGARNCTAASSPSVSTGTSAAMASVISGITGANAMSASASSGPNASAMTPASSRMLPMCFAISVNAGANACIPARAPSSMDPRPDVNTGSWRASAIPTMATVAICVARSMIRDRVGARLMNASPSACMAGPRLPIASWAPLNTVVSAPCHAGPRSAVFTRSRPAARSLRDAPPADRAAVERAPKMPMVCPSTAHSPLRAVIPFSTHCSNEPSEVMRAVHASNCSICAVNAAPSRGRYAEPASTSRSSAEDRAVNPSTMFARAVRVFSKNRAREF